jgi:hypothetical protein
MNESIEKAMDKEDELRHKHWYLFPLVSTIFLISLYKCGKTVYKFLIGKKINWREA